MQQPVHENSLFAQALDRVSDAICFVTIDGDIVYANKQFCGIYGIDSQPYQGKIYDLAISTPSAQAFAKRLQQIRENGGQFVYQARFISPADGQVHYHQASSSIMSTPQGDLVAIFMQDITELMRSRDELRELNTLMDTILDNLPVYLFVKDVDDDLRYVYWNKAFADYSKIPASKVIGRTDFEIFPNHDDAKKFRDDDLELIRNKEPFTDVETYESADGRTRMVQTLKVLCPREGRGPLLIGASLDITNMQNIEQELVQERLRAERSDRLKSTFLANMSHEIRTPLNAIVGFSNLLVQDDIDSESKEQFAEIINQNSESLLQLINDILDISKIEAGTLEYVKDRMNLAETMEHIHQSQHSHITGSVDLVLDIDPEYPQLIITEDRVRIAQVVNNLINNAAKFTKAGEITFGYRVEGDWVRVFVKDTGIGIAPDKLDKVFDRFVKLDTFAKGTGLGLSICKLIVNLMGGEITVQSKQGEGSTFEFTIPFVADKILNKQVQPRIKEAASQQSDKPEHADPEDNTMRTILVAEDTHSNWLLLRTLIGKSYNLIWAKDGQQAVEMYRDYKPDLILMDIKMPGIDGLEATRMIRNHSKDIPIIALTAYAFESDRQQALDAGMDDVLTKPVQMPLLTSTLNRYLG